MAIQNTATYKGSALLQGPNNFMHLKHGVGPSFGVFRCDKTTLTALQATAATAGTLVLSSGIAPVAPATLADYTLSLAGLYLVRAQLVQDGTGSVDDQIYDITLADERILWPKLLCTANYNTYNRNYATSREIDAEFDYVLDNLNGGIDEYTYAQILTDVATVLGVTISITDTGIGTLTRNPRNYWLDGLPATYALARILHETNTYIVPDYKNGASEYNLHKIGGTENAAEVTVVTTRIAQFRESGGVSWVNPKTLAPASGSVYAALDVQHDPDYFGRMRMVSSGAISGSGTGVAALLLEHALAYDAGTQINESYIDAIGDEVIAELAASYNNAWRDAILIGIHTLPLDSVIQEITWTNNERGAFTRIQSYRTTSVKPVEMRSTPFHNNDYTLVPPRTVEWGRPDSDAPTSPSATIDLIVTDEEGVDLDPEETITVYLRNDLSEVQIDPREWDTGTLVAFMRSIKDSDDVSGVLVGEDIPDKVRVSVADTTPGYLRYTADDQQAHDKIIGDSETDAESNDTGYWLVATIINAGNDEQLKIEHVGPGPSCYCWSNSCYISGGDVDEKGHVRYLEYYNGAGTCCIGPCV